jgi:hypothetical protein
VTRVVWIDGPEGRLICGGRGWGTTVLGMARLSRRSFLAAAAASIATPSLLAACGNDGSGAGAKAGSSSTSGGTELIRFNQDGYMIPGHQRLPIGLADSKGAVITAGPPTLAGRVLDASGKVVGAELVARRGGKDMPRPFWLFEMAADKPGQYQLQVDAPGAQKAMFFTVKTPADVPTPNPGDPLRFVETPTVANPRGVNPICTRNPICPFHSVSLKDAPQLGKPIVFIISTPAYCQFAVCGPVLDFVIAEQQRLGDKLTVVHSEVYTDDTKDKITPTVEAYGVNFEPVLYLADASGKVVDRWDVLFDQAGLATALDKLVA